MREALAFFVACYFFMWTFFPAALGKAIGENAGMFMRAFEISYAAKKAND